MISEEFKKLIIKRENWVKSSKENKFDFESILTGQYNDPSHFVYEIIQNAEDACAKEISFVLLNDHLEITHNGDDFNFEDVDAITGIGISTKKDDINAIGKFGVGFKSVFAITKTPVIHSGEYHFEIKDFVVPNIINSKPKIEFTKIILPFNHPTRCKDEVFELIGNKLENIGLKILLFLSIIKEIKWQTPNKSGHYYKSSEAVPNIINSKRVSIISEIGNDEFFEEYIIISKLIRIENQELKVEIAYRIGEDNYDNEIIIPEKDSKLIVFFPTEKVTYLNFLIQGPFKTTPNRENIPLDNEQNRFIISEIGNLVAESISIIKDMAFLNTSFLNVLPIDKNYRTEIIYKTIYDRVKEKFLSDEELLPTSKSNYSHPKQSLLARGKELVDFIDCDDLEFLFNKHHWLDQNITYDRTRELRDYLIDELGVKEIVFEDFAVKVSSEFFDRKNDDWMIDFYSKLLDQRVLWRERSYGRTSGILRYKPIIRLTDNTHIEPYDTDERIQVYLPTDIESKYKTVKPILAENEDSLKFLKDLGLNEPDIFAEIMEFILPKYEVSDITIDDDEYFIDFEKFLVAYNQDSPDKKRELLSKLKKLPIINSVNLVTGEEYLKKPNEIYLKTSELIEYFYNYDSAFFVSDELYNRFIEKNLDNFLIEIGCANKPRRIKIEPNLTWEEKSELRGNSRITHEIHTIDYDYDGLDNFLSHITKDKSFLLWKLLLNNLAGSQKWNKSDFFKGEYRWLYYSKHKANFDARFLKILKSRNWLFDNDNNIKKPSELTISDLYEDYIKEDENVEILLNVLGFQLDEIKRIEEKTGGKFIPKEEVEEYEKWQAEKTKSEEDSEEKHEDEWIPDFEPEDVETTIREVEPTIIITPDLRNQDISNEDDFNTENNNEGDTTRP